MLKGLMKIFLVRIINHVIVHTHKKFDDPEMVSESCKTKLIWLKLEELDKIFEIFATFARVLRDSRKSCKNLKNLVQFF